MQNNIFCIRLLVFEKNYVQRVLIYRVWPLFAVSTCTSVWNYIIPYWLYRIKRREDSRKSRWFRTTINVQEHQRNRQIAFDRTRAGQIFKLDFLAHFNEKILFYIFYVLSGIERLYHCSYHRLSDTLHSRTKERFKVDTLSAEFILFTYVFALHDKTNRKAFETSRICFVVIKYNRTEDRVSLP